MGKSCGLERDWKSFWKAKPIRAILKAFSKYPHNAQQAKIAGGLLRRFYEQAQPLEELYSELPRVYRGDKQATSRFLEILSNVVEKQHLTSEVFRNFSFQPSSGVSLKCPDSPLVPRSRVIHLLEGVLYLTGHDKKQFGSHANAVLHLWAGIRCPDYLTLWAQRDARDGGTRFNDELDRITKLNKYEDRVVGLDNISSVSEFRVDAAYTYLHGSNPLGWPPPSPGWPNAPIGCGPDDGPVPIPLGDEPCDMKHRLCEDLIRRVVPEFALPPDAISNIGIESISPNAACAGAEVTIYGSGFGDVPDDRVVVFGSKEAEPVFWSDTKIIVRVPPSTGEVCISFRSKRREVDRQEAHQRNQDTITRIRHCFGGSLFTSYIPQAARCNGKNSFIGNDPIIRRFTINNRNNSFTVEVGTPLVVRWDVDNAHTVTINRIGTDGPTAAISGSYSGEATLGPFIGILPTTATYRIEAIGTCNTLIQDVVVTLTSTPNLSSVGLEVTQTIQQYTIGSTVGQHLVQLVANKLTMVRVYPISGLNTGFDFGKGPNVLPNVTGSLILNYPNGETEHVRTPINPNGLINAQPQVGLDRGNLEHSLNFILPLEKLKGSVQVYARLYVSGFELDAYSGRTAWGIETTVLFMEQGKLEMVVTLIGDNTQGLSAPSYASFLNLLQGCRTRFPISEDGFDLFIPPNHRVIQTGENLTTERGWSNLLDRLDDIADDYDAENAIWCGIVPSNALLPTGTKYFWGGLANDGINDWWFDDHKRLLCIANSPWLFAHEVAHTLGIKHAGNSAGCSSNIKGVDSNIPTLTEDVGIDVAAATLIPAGSNEFMSYCANKSLNQNAEYNWPSILVYNRLFGRF